MGTRASVCSALLKHFRSKGDFLRLMNGNETWVHYNESENKAQSRQWVGPGSPSQKSLRHNHLLAKPQYLDFLPKRSTVTGVYYANLLDQLRTAFREKRRGKLSKGVLLQQDNARVHTCKVEWML